MLHRAAETAKPNRVIPMHANSQVVVVTGAASGIGRAVCQEMGRSGFALGLLDRNAPALAEFEQELKSAGIPCATAVADVRSREQTREALAALSLQLGPIDILIASAGICGISVVDDLKVPKVEEMIQVNFLGVVYSIEAVLPEMLKRQRGHIVGISSLAAIRAIPFESGYCASKAAVAAYLESLRPALRGRGITMTTVYPGFVRTPLLDHLLTASGAGVPPGVVEVETAARKIAKAIRRRARVCCFPRSTSWLAHGSRLLPAAVYDWIMTRIASRVPQPY